MFAPRAAADNSSLNSLADVCYTMRENGVAIVDLSVLSKKSDQSLVSIKTMFTNDDM